MRNTQIKIGPCLLDFQTMTLSRGENSSKLSVKVFELLKLFLDADEHIVSREQAISIIWQGNEGVGKRGYTNAVWTLRKSFKELGLQDQEIFLTLPKVGYQLALNVAEVKQVSPTKDQEFKISNIAIAALITIILLTVIWYLKQVENPPIDNASQINRTETQLRPSPYKITNFEGIEEHPAISNSGQYVAFLWHREHFAGGIYIKDLEDDATPLNLVSMTDDQESSPAWSYNDQSLAYIRSTNHGICEVRVRNLLSNSDELIDDNCLYKPFTRVISWANGESNKLVYSKQVDSGVSLFVYDFQTETIDQLTYAKPGEIDFSPAWSADNNSILFIRQSPSQSFNVILQDKDLNQQVIIKDKVSIVDLEWATDTNHIYVNYSDHGKFMIVKKSLTDNIETTILAQGLPSNISLNKKKGELVYSDHISKEYIALVDYKTGRIGRRISSSSRDMYGRYNCKNGNILFLSNRNGEWSVWLNNKLTSRNLHKKFINATVPAISHDGNLMVVNLSDAEKQPRKLYLVDLNTSIFTELETDGLFTDNLSWSRDNKSIYFFSRKQGQSGIFKLTIATGKVEQLTFAGEQYAIEYEDGLLYASITNKRGIWAIDVNAKKTTLVTPELAEYDYAAFFIEDKQIYYINREADEDQVKRISINDESEIVQRFPANSIRKFYGISKGNNESFIATLKISNEADISAVSVK